ncbi:MAG: hypothetical protein MZV70_52210 [Desulfobacterales bacterium]|nr:hypothetical protein [Desulfobacterales bacterium]
MAETDGAGHHPDRLRRRIARSNARHRRGDPRRVPRNPRGRGQPRALTSSPSFSAPIYLDGGHGSPCGRPTRFPRPAELTARRLEHARRQAPGRGALALEGSHQGGLPGPGRRFPGVAKAKVLDVNDCKNIRYYQVNMAVALDGGGSPSTILKTDLARVPGIAQGHHRRDQPVRSRLRGRSRLTPRCMPMPARTSTWSEAASNRPWRTSSPSTAWLRRRPVHFSDLVALLDGVRGVSHVRMYTPSRTLTSAPVRSRRLGQVNLDVQEGVLMSSYFERKLIDLLPPALPGTGRVGRSRRHFSRCLPSSLDELKVLAERFPEIFDIDRCEARFLPYLGEIVGHRFDPTVDAAAPAAGSSARPSKSTGARAPSPPSAARSPTSAWEGRIEETFRKALRLNRRSVVGRAKLPGLIYSLGVYRIDSDNLVQGVWKALPFHHPAGTRVFFLQWLYTLLSMESDFERGHQAMVVERVVPRASARNVRGQPQRAEHGFPPHPQEQDLGVGGGSPTVPRSCRTSSEPPACVSRLAWLLALCSV